MNKLPIYFSHGYRQREAVFNKYFGVLLDNYGFIPSLDPPSGDVNSAKLEKHLKHTVGLIAIVANRGGGISPYIRYEIDLAIRIGKPILLFVEDTVADNLLPNVVLRKRFSTSSFFRDYHEHQNALDIYKLYIGSYRLPKYQSLSFQKSAIIIGFNHKNKLLNSYIVEHLKFQGYNIIFDSASNQKQTVLHGADHFALSNLHLAVCLLDDMTQKDTYLLGALRSVQIPGILITKNKHSSITESIPPEFQQRLIPYNKPAESIKIIISQISLYEEDFVSVDDEKKWEGYVETLITAVPSNGEYSDELRKKIINNIYMGDHFEHVSGTIVNRSVVEKSFNKLSEKLDKDDVELLKSLTNEVEKSGNREAVEILEEFHKEIQKPSPKKSLLNSFWNGLAASVPSIIINADKVVDLIEKVTKIVPH